MPTSPVDSRRSLHETAVPTSAPVLPSQPVVRFDLPLWECPTSFPTRFSLPPSPVDSRRSLHETAVPPSAPVLPSQPVVRFDLPLWECPTSFPHRFSLVSSPSAPVVESSCPMTSDSRSCKDSSSASFQNLQSTDHRPLRLLCSLSPACTLPRPLSS